MPPRTPHCDAKKLPLGKPQRTTAHVALLPASHPNKQPPCCEPTPLLVPNSPLTTTAHTTNTPQLHFTAPAATCSHSFPTTFSSTAAYMARPCRTAPSPPPRTPQTRRINIKCYLQLSLHHLSRTFQTLPTQKTPLQAPTSHPHPHRHVPISAHTTETTHQQITPHPTSTYIF